LADSGNILWLRMTPMMTAGFKTSLWAETDSLPYWKSCRKRYLFQWCTSLSEWLVYLSLEEVLVCRR